MAFYIKRAVQGFDQAYGKRQAKTACLMLPRRGTLNLPGKR